MKSQMGASLTSFVVATAATIILGGTTLSVTIGENGIVQKASYATNAYKIAEYQERISMIAAGDFINSMILNDKINNIDMESVKTEIEKEKWVKAVNKENDKLIVNTTEDYILEVTVDEDGNISVVDQNDTLKKAIDLL